MKHRKVLLTKQEVIQWASLSNISECNIETIDSIVRCEFNDCLGKEFLKYLIDHLNCYDDPEEFDVSEYDPEQTYNEGDIVIYDCVYYKVKKEVQGIDPLNSECFCLAEKFDEECLNELWCNGSLARYLSLLVARQSIVPNMVQMTSMGIGRRRGDGFEPVSTKGMEMLMAHYSTLAQNEFTLLHQYMIDNKECGCFDYYKGLAIKCCGGCGCKKKECVCDNCKTAKTEGFLPMIC